MATNKTQQIMQQIEHNKFCYQLNTKNIAKNTTQLIQQQIKHNKYCNK